MYIYIPYILYPILLLCVYIYIYAYACVYIYIYTLYPSASPSFPPLLSYTLCYTMSEYVILSYVILYYAICWIILFAPPHPATC